jgi:uncharacterized repeat protein (TIGR01451 family)
MSRTQIRNRSRRWVLGFVATLTLVGASLSLIEAATPSSAAGSLPGQGIPFSCTAGTIYNVQFGPSGGNGTLNAVDTSTITGSSVTDSPITSIPGGADANALGITAGGAGAYAVKESNGAGTSTTVYGYDAATQAWTDYTGTGAAGVYFIAGDVNPATNVYYYAYYADGTATIYGFNTNTNTAIPGIIATAALPVSGTGGFDGDMSFDAAGNLYLVTSLGTSAGVAVVPGPLPTTGSTTGTALISTTLQTFSSSISAGWNGIAFDNTGNLFIQYASGANSYLLEINPDTGAIIAGPTQQSTTTYLDADLGACTRNPTLEVQKDIVSRAVSTDQFGLSITGGGVAKGNTATTTGTTTGLQSAVAGPVIAESGTGYTIAETAASGTLADYTSTYSCVDQGDANTVVASGTGSNFTLTDPQPATGEAGEIIICTFTNTPKAGISLAKSASVSSYSAPGTLVTYSYLVTNTGDVTLTPVTVTDPMAGLSAIACPVASLAPTVAETCTATYTTTQADVNAGSLKNTGTVTATPPTGAAVTDTSSVSVPAVQSPGVSLVKSASVSSYSAAGTPITYSYLVTNTGNVTLNPVTVTDPMTGLSAMSCPDTSLVPAGSETCTATYTTTQADVDAGSLKNTGTVSGTPPKGSAVTASSSVTLTVGQSPSLRLVKSASVSSFSAPGVPVTYSYVVTNTGNVTLNPVTVTDPMSGLSAITCPVTSLAPTGSETCTAAYTTTQADVDAGKINNTGIASGTPPTGSAVTDTSSVSVPAVQSPAVSLVKSANVSSYSAPGTPVTYSYLVTNTGNVILNPVTVTDPMARLSAVSCPDTALTPNEVETCSATYTTTQADVNAGSIKNTGTASGTPPKGSAVTDTSAVSVLAVQTPSLSLLKSASVSSYSAPGTLVTYSYLVTNTGNVLLNPVTVTDPMTGLSAVSCPVAVLAPAVSETCTASYTTTQADVNTGSINNTGTVSGTPPKGLAVTDTSSVSVPAVQTPSLSLLKSASVSSFSAPGAPVTYSYLVTNTGNVTLNPVTVTDPMTGLSAVSCPDPALTPNQAETCAATYTTTQADVNAASIKNTGTASGTPPKGSAVTDTSAVSVPAVQTPSLSLLKSASVSSYSAPGARVTYSYLVTNTGNVTLNPVTVTDPMTGLSAISCPDPALTPNEEETCAATYTTTQADVNAGSIKNTGTASGTPPEGSPVSSTSSLTVPFKNTISSGSGDSPIGTAAPPPAAQVVPTSSGSLPFTGAAVTRSLEAATLLMLLGLGLLGLERGFRLRRRMRPGSEPS